MDRKKAISAIGLSMKAGKLASGGFAVEQAVREEKAALVIIAEDCSGNTGKKFRNMCKWHKTEIVSFLSKEELGRAVGKDYRSCAAVLDEGLAQVILGHMGSGSGKSNSSGSAGQNRKANKGQERSGVVNK